MEKNLTPVILWHNQRKPSLSHCVYSPSPVFYLSPYHPFSFIAYTVLPLPYYSLASHHPLPQPLLLLVSQIIPSLKPLSLPHKPLTAFLQQPHTNSKYRLGICQSQATGYEMSTFVPFLLTSALSNSLSFLFNTFLHFNICPFLRLLFPSS